MTPELVRQLTGGASLVAFLGLLFLFATQLALRPNDRQKWAATNFVFATLLVVGQLVIAYLGGPGLSTSWRGVASYLYWALTIVGLAYETHRHVRRAGRRRRRRE